MRDKEFIFCGNRSYVLEEMLNLNLKVKKICAVEGSYLEKFMKENKLQYELLKRKEQLIKILKENDFDFFISNGCPFILPVNKIKTERKTLINIHPSYLPDLRGADPQPAAILNGKDSGATCHVMDDGIDTGDIISQFKIKYSSEYDVNLLYQLTFWAERQVFIDAYNRAFKPKKKQRESKNQIYYSFNPEDLILNFYETAQQIHRKIQAFNNPNKGARFLYKNNEFRVYNSSVIQNQFIQTYLKGNKENEIVLRYNDSIGLNKDGQLLILKNIVGDLSKVNLGEIILQKEFVVK